MGSCLKWAAWFIVGFVVVSVICSVVDEGQGNDESEPSFDESVGPIDLLATHLEMRRYCEGNLNIWERAGRWLLIEDVYVHEMTDRELASFVVIIEALCDKWQSDGLEEVARVFESETAHEKFFKELREDDTVQERLRALEKELQENPAIRSLIRLN